MVTIKVVLLGTRLFFPCFTHIAAVITDTETGRHFLVNRPFGSYGEADPRANRADKAMQLYQHAWPNLCVDTRTLYSERSYQEFLDHIAPTLRGRNFAWLENNCANAVNEMLDFFFPETAVSQTEMYLLLLTLPTWYFPAGILMGILSCALEAANVKTPVSVFDKACVLARSHYAPLQNQGIDWFSGARTHNDEDTATYQVENDKLDETLMKNFLRPLKMI